MFVRAKCDSCLTLALNVIRVQRAALVCRPRRCMFSVSCASVIAAASRVE